MENITLAEQIANAPSAETLSTTTPETVAGSHNLEAQKREALTPQDHARQTAKEVRQRLSSESIDAAYQELRGDVDNAKESMSGADFKRYRAELTSSLEGDGALPRLSLAWADKAFDKLDGDTSGSIQESEFKAYMEQVHNVDELTARLARNFVLLEGHRPVSREYLRIAKVQWDSLGYTDESNESTSSDRGISNPVPEEVDGSVRKNQNLCFRYFGRFFYAYPCDSGF